VGVSPMQFRKQSSGPKHSQYTSGAPHQRLEH
jgi:hypothetical protein